MNTSTPVIFADGTDFYSDLAQNHARHNRGFFILAPSGAGKTYFVSHQAEKHWIDGDDLWPAANADRTHDGWDVPFETVMEINNKSDVITHEARKQGFWVVGSSNHWLKPDAIVLPPWDRHRSFVRKRETTSYDGGATSNDLEGLKAHRRWIRGWKKQGVPCFESVQAAADYLQGHFI